MCFGSNINELLESQFPFKTNVLMRVYCETIKKSWFAKVQHNSVALKSTKSEQKITMKNIKIKMSTKYFILCESTKHWK